MRRAGVAFAIMLVLTPLRAAAGAASCLASDPAAAGDAAELLAVREAVDTQCPCGGAWHVVPAPFADLAFGSAGSNFLALDPTLTPEASL